jgi:hypothetical protein
MRKLQELGVHAVFKPASLYDKPPNVRTGVLNATFLTALSALRHAPKLN